MAAVDREIERLVGMIPPNDVQKIIQLEPRDQLVKARYFAEQGRIFETAVILNSVAKIPRLIREGFMLKAFDVSVKERRRFASMLYHCGHYRGAVMFGSAADNLSEIALRIKADSVSQNN